MTAGAPAAPDVSAVLAGLLHRPEWHQRAACSGMGTDGFVVRHCGRYRCRSGRSARAARSRQEYTRSSARVSEERARLAFRRGQEGSSDRSRRSGRDRRSARGQTGHDHPRLASAIRGLPEPVATLSSGLVWAWPDVAAWAKATGREIVTEA